MGEEIVLADVEVPVEKEEKLLLHEIHLGQCETEPFVASDG